MSGWVPLDAASWPIIAEHLAKPWPREAILFDLRWWADQERMGRARRPGRIVLQDRWGVTQWAYRELCKAESEWSNPIAPPTDRPPSAHAPPTDRPRAHGDTPNIDENPPARRPSSAHPPPTRRPTRGDDIRQTTDRHTENTPLPPASQGERSELHPSAAWMRDRLLGELLDMPVEEADAYAERLAEPTRDVIDVLRSKTRLVKVDVRDVYSGTKIGETYKRAMNGVPERMRRKDMHAGAIAAARNWPEMRALARDLTLKGHESTGPPATADPDDTDFD